MPCWVNEETPSIVNEGIRSQPVHQSIKIEKTATTTKCSGVVYNIENHLLKCIF